MSATKKITKKEYCNILLSLVDNAEDTGYVLEGGATYEGVRDHLTHEIELLDSKAAAAQKRAAEKKQEGDALREEIYNLLSETEFATIDQIVAALNNPDVTRNMVTSRLGQLSKLDMIEKEMVSTGGENGKARKATAYRKKA